MPYARGHKKRTRNRILESAHRLFTAKGFEATSIEEVMQECNLTRGGFYAHFQSKAQLYQESMAGAAPVCASPNPAFCEDSGRWLETIFDSCLLPYDMLKCGASRWAFLALDIASKQPEVRTAYAAAFKNMSKRLRHEAAQSARVDQAALAATAMIIGALAVATTVDEHPLKAKLVAACRDQARALLEEQNEDDRLSFFWAADHPKDRQEPHAAWAVH